MNLIKDKLKILYAGRYNTDEIPSGVIFTARCIFNEHCNNNYGVFIQYFFDGRKYGIIKKLFGKVIITNDNKTIITAGIFKILCIVNNLRPKIIHIINYERFAIIFFLYKIFFNVKIIYNIHGVLKYENKLKQNLNFLISLKDTICEYIYLRISDKIIFTSEQALDKAEEYYKIDESKVIILPNGVNELFYNNHKKQNLNKINAVIHFKNELNSSGIEFLKKSLDLISKDIKIFIITNLSTDLDKYENIKIINLMDHNKLKEFYNDKDVILNLNKYDTFSIATAEAMASGLIPIVTNYIGISRYIVNDVNGWIIEFNDIRNLNEILNKILLMPSDKRVELSNKTRISVQDLKPKNIYDLYEQIYEDILK